MTREGEAERPDPLAEASRATIEINLLEEDLDRARRLIDDNKWGEDEGLLNVFITGLYYLLGERRLQAVGSEHDSRAQEMESLVKDLMLYQSMYAVMKYRAFTLSEQKYVLEGNVSGLEAADRFASARLRMFRRDEEALKAEIERLREENEQLRKRLTVETSTPRGQGKQRSELKGVAAMEAIATVGIDTERTAGYIESCQTEDGGFFFARIPPSGGADTYYAVRSLQLLGREPVNAEAVRGWLRESAQGELTANPKGIFFLIETGLALGLPVSELRGWAAGLSDWANAEGGFGAWRNVDVEVSSELDITCRAAVTILDLGLELNREAVSHFVLRFLNIDGGFGANSFSTLASTFYAVETLSRLGFPPLDLTVEWLRRREVFWDVLYLEQLHRLVMSLTALGEAVRERDRAIDFVLHCRRENGGFARARFGIPTLENTHYALEVLSLLEVI